MFSVPVEPAPFAIDTVPAALTVPPLEMVRVPVPSLPTARLLEVQDEPRPSTVAKPVEPEVLPIKPRLLIPAPPLPTISVPVPVWPTARLLELVQVEPAPVTLTLFGPA